MTDRTTPRALGKRSCAHRNLRLERLEDRMLLHGAPDFIHDTWPAFFGGALHTPGESNVINLGAAPTDAPRMRTPIAGTANQDWAIMHYVDLNTNFVQYPPSTEFGSFGFPYLNQTRDYRGRTNFDAYTYDQHGGIDITLPNFAAQDVGVPVYAAADGTVDEIHDGEFDRQYNGDGDNVTNRVRINHGNDWYTNYIHLRKDSVTVVPGQQVRKGDVVGLVGSSGVSIGSHLHFEVKKCVHDIPGNPGGCTLRSVESYQHENTFWDSPLPYAGDVHGALDWGMTANDPAVASPVPWYELLSRPVEQKVFTRPQTAFFWVNLHGIEPNPGDQFRFRWYSPDGNEVFPPRPPYLAAEMHFGWQWDRLDIGPTSPRGVWKVEFIYRNQILAQDTFLVTDNPDLLQGDVGFNTAEYHITEKGVSDFGGAVRLTVWRTSPYESISVNYATADNSARAGTDYVATSGTIPFAQGERVKTIDIPLIHDPCPEDEESFHVTLGNPTDQASLMSPSVAKVFIHDTSNGVRVDPSTKALIVEGCGGNDQIEVTVARNTEADYVAVNLTLAPDPSSQGPTQEFSRTFDLENAQGVRLIESIVLRGGGGDDTIDLTTVANTFMQIPVRVEGNDGQDTLEVHADRYTNLAGPNGFTVLGGAGDDTIELESLDDGGIFGGFVLDGESDHDHFIANDLRVGDFGEEVEYTLRSGVIDRGSFGRLPFAGMEEITVNASNLRNIFYVDATTPGAATTLNAGYGRDDIFVAGVAASSQAFIHGGGENDYIVVNGDVAGERTTIYGDEDADQIEVLWGEFGPPPLFARSHGRSGLSINGGGAGDRLVLDDTSSPHGDVYAVHSSFTSADGPFDLIASMIHYQLVEEVVLKSGGGGNTFNVNDSPAGMHVVIEAGAGNDSVQVGTGNLDVVNGRTTVSGQAGTDSVRLVDNATNLQDTYTLTNTTISRPFFASHATDGLTYESVESVTLEAQHGKNTFLINSTVAAPISINAGLGDDDFLFADGGGVAGRIDGQDGTDTLDYRAYRTPAEVNRVAGTATGIGGGFANIENVLGATLVSAFNVLDRKAAIDQLVDISSADTLLGHASGDLRIASETFAGLGVIDFVDPQNAGSFGHFPVNNPFPNNTPTDNDDFAVKATAVVQIPTGGFWTFGTHSDDGVRLRIDGADVINDPLPHAPEDRFGLAFLTAGYHTLDLVFFERGGGATLELFAAPGFYSVFDPNFRLVGDVASGGLNVFTTTGISIRDVKRAGGSVASVADAYALLSLRAGNPGIASERSTIVQTVDLVDPQNSTGGVHFFGNRPFPNDSPADDNHFAVRADAFIYIPEGDFWTFGVNSDDGLRLRIDGNTVIDYPLPQGPTDRLGTLELSRGFHALNLVAFEQAGGAELELFAARGTQVGFNANFRLIGDSAAGGLLSLAPSNCLTVTNTLDGGPGSLREAIGCANILPGLDTISFAIAGPGVHTIRLLSPLPPTGDPVIIDGYSQPGSRPNSLAVGSDAILNIELDGVSAGPSASGLTLSSDNVVRGLAINRFAQNGIDIRNTHRNQIQGNYIGTNASGNVDRGNGGHGIAITADILSLAEQNLIGGVAPADRNVISGNGGDGVSITGAGARQNAIRGNFIGTDATGRYALGNSGDGIELASAYATSVGSSIFGGPNVISANGGHGVRIVGGNGPLAQPVSRWSGDGSPFDSMGINSGTAVGGTAYATGKFSQAFSLDGVDDHVEISDLPSHTTSAFSLDAWVRPDSFSYATIASKYDSRFAGGTSWSLQGLPDGKVEFIVFQSNSPTIILRGVTTAQSVLTIGAWRHVAATFDLSTQQMEIYIDGSRVVTTPYATSQTLTSIADSATPMRIGAIVASGTITGPTHFWDGLLDEVALYNRTLSAGEVLALYRRNVGGHSLTGNYIGTDVTRALSLGNAADGIYVSESSGNTVGSVFANFGNTVAHNAGAGVTVASGAGNAILTNRIFANSSLGIDLADDAVTPNDPLDADSGANDLQNFPQVNFAVLKPNGVAVSGSFVARLAETYTLQFFANESCDPSGQGEGTAMIGSMSLPAGAPGNTNFATQFLVFGPVAPFITATATDATGNTSEFSTCRITTPELLGDADVNGRVDLRDLAIVRGRLGESTNLGPLRGDLNGDGVINRTDIALLALNFGRSTEPPPAPSAPAPAVPAQSRRKATNHAAIDIVLTASPSRDSSPSKLRARSSRHRTSRLAAD